MPSDVSSNSRTAPETALCMRLTWLFNLLSETRAISLCLASRVASASQSRWCSRSRSDSTLARSSCARRSWFSHSSRRIIAVNESFSVSPSEGRRCSADVTRLGGGEKIRRATHRVWLCAVLLTALPQDPRRDCLERPPKLLPDGLVQAHSAIAQARLQQTFLGLGN